MEIQKICDQFSKICRSNELGNGVSVESLWSSIVELINEEPNSFLKIVQYIEIFNDIIPDFREQNPPVIAEWIAKITSDKTDMKTFEILMYLFPYISLDNTKNLVKAAADFVNIECFEKYIKFVDFIEVASIPQNIYEETFEILKQSTKPETVLFFAPLAIAYTEHVNEANNFFINLAMKLLENEPNEIVAGCFLLERLSMQLGQEPQVVPSDLFEKLLKLILVDNKIIQYRANKALRRLIECGAFDKPEYSSLLIEEFSKYNVNDYCLFFKLINKYLGDTETVSLETIKPIFEFAVSNITKDIEVDGYLISIFTFFLSIDQCFLKDLLKDCLLTAHKLILNKKEQFYSDIVEFIYEVINSFGESKVLILAKDIESVSNSLDNEKLSIKRKTLIAQSLAGISSFSFVQQIIPKLIDFVLANFKSAKNNLIFNFCTIITILMNQMNKDQIIEIYNEMKQLSFVEMNFDRLNALIDTINKILKQNKELDSTDFIQKMINGEFSYLCGLPFYVSADDKLIIFHFLKSYIKRNPTKVEQVIEKLIQITGIIPSTMIPSISEPLIKIIELNILSDSQYQTLLDYLTELIPIIDIYNDASDEFSVISFLISKILFIKKDLQIQKLTESIESIVIKCSDEGEEEETIPTESLVIALQLYTQIISISKTYNKEALNNVIKSFSILQRSKSLVGIIASLFEIEFSKESLEELYLPFLKFYVNVFLMDKKECQEQNITNEQIEKIRLFLKTELHKDQKLEKELTKDFPRNKLNRFKAVYK